ncbi:MAG: adenine-specific methyltransferase EcoRI family protein [Bacteroidales bacterium]|nr:adenine-specific methyltransferase EcoRI family protein [Bacteroidales bacterium]
MAGNKSLHEANKAKKDEFYTQLSDIEKELKHYKAHFLNKIVLCNCDDPRVSNFFHYFSYNFEVLGLKKLITTCYKSQNRDLFSQNDSERAIWLEYFGDRNGNRVPDPEEIGIHYFNGDGDFRSTECIELLKEADIVVTNPPFSLFREYVAQLMNFNKKFLVIGNQNNVTYKEIFPLLSNNKIWLGINSGAQQFEVPLDYEKGNVYMNEYGKKYAKFGNICWFTNLDNTQRHEELILYKKYTPEEYPKYDNYDAINVEKIAEIPNDYYGIMGVPITFMEKYNPEQFEIVGITDRNSPLCTKIYTKKDVSNYSDLNRRSVLVIDGKYKMLFPKILIRRRNKNIPYTMEESQLSMAAESGTEKNNENN